MNERVTHEPFKINAFVTSFVTPSDQPLTLCFCPVNQGGQEGAPEVVGEQKDPKNRYTSHMGVGTGSEEQVAQGQYVVSDTRCPAFHGYKLE